MREKLVREFIFHQFEDASTQNELKDYCNRTNVDWVSRTKRTIDEFLPTAFSLADHIVELVPKRLNSPFMIEEVFESRRQLLLNDPQMKAWAKTMSEYISINRELVGVLESQQVSAEIQRQVQLFGSNSVKMLNNGNSIYPDFIYRDRDYSTLPLQDRRKTVHGPCIQGKKVPRPSNVPDGIELKTNRGRRMRIDAHAPHIGLHLGFTWDYGEEDGRLAINGAWLAFIAEKDHKESARNSKTTTVKYSFGQDKFISLLPDAIV